MGLAIDTGAHSVAAKVALAFFDFGPTAVDVPGKFDQWTGWLGHQQASSIAIWLEIDRAKVLANLWDAGTARKKWHEPPYGEFIHGVEACHGGPIPLVAVVSTLLIARDNRISGSLIATIKENGQRVGNIAGKCEKTEAPIKKF